MFYIVKKMLTSKQVKISKKKFRKQLSACIFHSFIHRKNTR
ncbi:hypothetical protein CPter91_0995 [Collimonas pratensis]|uniref:Uncharacterized protein n=1 Tax=Collimonas pratensis TaxID=279113 RepID=A0A127Q027_9BURK|nr:hypothetical protein CPter91_0995 [Collimonas pratensis]